MGGFLRRQVFRCTFGRKTSLQVSHSLDTITFVASAFNQGAHLIRLLSLTKIFNCQLICMMQQIILNLSFDQVPTSPQLPPKTEHTLLASGDEPSHTKKIKKHFALRLILSETFLSTADGEKQHLQPEVNSWRQSATVNQIVSLYSILFFSFFLVQREPVRFGGRLYWSTAIFNKTRRCSFPTDLNANWVISQTCSFLQFRWKKPLSGP